MIKLDRSRSFGTIHYGGVPRPGRFVQDDLEFDANDECITTEATTPAAAAALIAGQAKVEAGPTRKQLVEQLRLMGGKPGHNSTLASLQTQIDDLEQ